MQRKYIAAIIVLTGALLPVWTDAQTVLIGGTTLNGNFGLPATKTTFASGGVPDWSVWTPALGGPSPLVDGDSGVQPGASESTPISGQNIAYFQGGSTAYDLTSWTIASGDVYSYSWDWVLQGRGTATAELGYWNGTTLTAIAGTATSAQSNSGTVLDVTGGYTAGPTDPAIGSDIALIILAPSGSNYPEVDNVNLTVVPAPEPSIAALAGLGVLALFVVKRKQFAC